MNRVLIIEDDADITTLLRHALQREGGFEVVDARDGSVGLAAALRTPPDLILLDLHLPELGGFEVCRRLRSSPSTSSVPIIMVTARVGETDKVAGLELGADDYITKPFSIKEVVARIRAVLRRANSSTESSQVFQVGALTLDESRRQVFANGGEIVLTRKEFDLLADLLRQRGRVLSRDRLLERVWGYDHPGATRTVDVHIRQLRKKLGSEVAQCIETVVGVGYRFRQKEP